MLGFENMRDMVINSIKDCMIPKTPPDFMLIPLWTWHIIEIPTRIFEVNGYHIMNFDKQIVHKQPAVDWIRLEIYIYLISCYLISYYVDQ